MSQKQLRMERSDLTHLPEIEIPEGYALRIYQADDEVHWARIINATFGGKRTAQSARHELMERSQFRPEGLFFVTYSGKPVGTACAWIEPGQTEIGSLHMVGVEAEHQGHRLGRLVSLAVLHYLRNQSIQRAMLDTDDFRLPAIKTYINLGFIPLYREPSQPERWRRVYAELGLEMPIV